LIKFNKKGANGAASESKVVKRVKKKIGFEQHSFGNLFRNSCVLAKNTFFKQQENS